MLGVKLESDIERRLELLAKRTGRTKSYYARKAIIQYLESQEHTLLKMVSDTTKQDTGSKSDIEIARSTGLIPKVSKSRSVKR